MVWVCVSKWRDSTLVHTCDANANLNVSDIHTFSADKVRYALRFGHPNKADKVEELEDQNVYGSEKSFSKGKLRRLSSFGKRIANWRQSVLLLTYRTLSTNFSSDVISSTLSTGGVLTCLDLRLRRSCEPAFSVHLYVRPAYKATFFPMFPSQNTPAWLVPVSLGQPGFVLVWSGPITSQEKCIQKWISAGLVDTSSHEFVNKLVEWEGFIDPVRRECTYRSWKMNFFRDFCGYLCSCGVRKAHTEIVMLRLEWLGRLKWRATSLDASVSFLSASRRCSRN